MSKLQDRINAAKTGLTNDEVSDSAVTLLAEKEMEQEFITKVEEYCSELEDLKKVSGIKQEWKVHPKYAFGSLGVLGRFMTLWVYLPDSLKKASSIHMPSTAITSEDIEAWGNLPYATALGEVKDVEDPDFDKLKAVTELLKVYLQLPYLPNMLTKEQWDKKVVVARVKADKKGADIRNAMIDEDIKAELGLPTFVIPE